MQEHDNMKAVLTEFYQHVRSRNRTINIKVTFISWMVEFITGITFLLCTTFGTVQLRPYYTLFYVTSMCVFAPATYVINRDITKDKILESGWLHGIRSIFMPDRKVAVCRGHNEIPLRNLAFDSTRARAPHSTTTNEIILIPPRMTAHSSNEMHGNSEPKLEVETQIPKNSSAIIQPNAQPIILDSTDPQIAKMRTPVHLPHQIVHSTEFEPEQSRDDESVH